MVNTKVYINIRSLKDYNQDTTYRANLRDTDWSPVYSCFDSNDTVEKYNTILIDILGLNGCI